MEKGINKEIWIVTIIDTDVVAIYDDKAMAWRNATRLALGYGKIDYRHSASLEDFINSGHAWILTEKGKTISIETDHMNPNFGGWNEEV